MILLPGFMASFFTPGVSKPPPKRENLLINLACNLVVPTLVLTKLSGENRLGPVWGLVVGLSFPLGYGIWDFIKRRHTNVLSVLGFLSVLLSGGLGLLKVGGLGFAIKDAAIPTVIGLFVLGSTRTKRPLVRELLYNEQIINTAKVDAALAERGQTAGLDRLLAGTSYLLAGTFLVSAGINFALARYLLRSPAGTSEFTAELGQMHFWSVPVIVVPSMAMMMFALWRLLKGIETLTGLTLDDVLHAEAGKK